MILAVSLLAGCAAETSPTENTAAKYTEPERPPVSALQCTSPAALSAIHPAGRAKVIVFWPDYEAEITTIQIVDTASDTLIVSKSWLAFLSVESGLLYYIAMIITIFFPLEKYPPQSFTKKWAPHDGFFA